MLLGIGGALPAQAAVRRTQVFDVADQLEALDAKVGAVPGAVQPFDRLVRLLSQLAKRENRAGRVGVTAIRPRQKALCVHNDKELCDLVESALDELRREKVPRIHVTCTLLVMPWETAAAHGLGTNDVQEIDMATMTKLMRAVVKQKGTLRNLPETVTAPLVPFVAESRAGGDRKQPDGAANLRLRGEALALSPDEAMFCVQLVRGSLPEDRTILPKGALIDRAFRLRAGNGVTITAKQGKTATVLWLRFTGTSTEAPKPDKPAKPSKVYLRTR